MIKRLLMCLGLCLLLSSANAQSLSVEALLSGKQSPDSNTKVFFEEDINPPKPEFVPTPVSWTPEAPFISFTTPFGQTYKAQYVTHIPFIAFHVAVSPSGRVFVTEDIYYMSGEPAPTEPFKRTFYRSLTTLTQHKIQPHITILSTERDGVALPPRVSEDLKYLTVTLSDGPETRGLHHYVVSYILRDTMLWGKQGNALFLSLLGPRQPYPIERLAGVISFPAESTLLETLFAFGDNNLETDKATLFKEEQHRLVFRSKQWLQAQVDMRLSLSLSKKGFSTATPKDRASDAFFDKLWAFILLMCLILMSGYYAFQIYLSAGTVQSKTYQAKIRQHWSYKPAVMRLVLAKSIDRRTMASLMVMLATRDIIYFRQKGTTYELTRAEVDRRVSLSERLILRKLFKGEKTALLKDLSLPRFIKHQLIPSVHLAYGCQYFLLTKQYILMGAFLVALGVILSIISGAHWGAVLGVLACLLFVWALCLHLFFKKSAYNAFLRLLYEQYQAYMAGFSEDTPTDILLKNVPFAVALDLTSLFPLTAAQLPWLTTSAKSDSLSAVEKNIMQNLLYSKKTD